MMLPVNVANTTYRAISLDKFNSREIMFDGGQVQVQLELEGFGDLQAIFYKINNKQNIVEIWCLRKEMEF